MNVFYEFFAGGGMVRSGLGDGWKCVFANDVDHKKSSCYRVNWRDDVLKTEDVRNIKIGDLPDRADLAWASFPCQDLSLAGVGAGLKGERSGTFWPFWSLMTGLKKESRNPPIIALENVCGTLSSHSGKDFAAIGEAYKDLGYQFGAIVVDAVRFLPQSRPRLFIIGIRNDIVIPASLYGFEPNKNWHTKALMSAYRCLPQEVKNNWVWWSPPIPKDRDEKLVDIVEDRPTGVCWHDNRETEKILGMMSEANQKKLDIAKNAGGKIVGSIYKRTRSDKFGNKTQRAEIRFDQIAGCLRTPAGGSSRQILIFVEGGNVRTRLISSRETARLMGLPDSYQLPVNYNEAYHLTGDGVVVPVVRFLAQTLFEPVLKLARRSSMVAA